MPRAMCRRLFDHVHGVRGCAPFSGREPAIGPMTSPVRKSFRKVGGPCKNSILEIIAWFLSDSSDTGVQAMSVVIPERLIRSDTDVPTS